MKPNQLRNKLTPEESAEYQECVSIIRDGLKDFVRTGNALLRVSDNRLYREQYSTFEEFCRAEWDMSASRAYQLCQAAEIVKSLPEKVSTIVDTESKARELAKVPQGERAKVIKAALEAGPVTARAIREAAEEIEKPAVIAHAEAMPKTLDNKFRAAMGGTIPPVPKTGDPRRLGLLCYQCCVERLIPNATIEELESLRSFWHSDMHTSCLGLVNERLSELKAQAKQAAKAKKKGKK